MKPGSAVDALSALAHSGRLATFRELVRAGPGGLPAGEISRRIGIAPNTLSASLTILAHAGLVSGSRSGRSIIYSATYPQMAALLKFLMEDCCQGRPEVCASLAGIAGRAECRP